MATARAVKKDADVAKAAPSNGEFDVLARILAVCFTLALFGWQAMQWFR